MGDYVPLRDDFRELIAALEDIGLNIPAGVHDVRTLAIAVKANPPRSAADFGFGDPDDDDETDVDIFGNEKPIRKPGGGLEDFGV